jgi:hypothetical protein
MKILNIKYALLSSCVIFAAVLATYAAPIRGYVYTPEPTCSGDCPLVAKLTCPGGTCNYSTIEADMSCKPVYLVKYESMCDCEFLPDQLQCLDFQGVCYPVQVQVGYPPYFSISGPVYLCIEAEVVNIDYIPGWYCYTYDYWT